MSYLILFHALCLAILILTYVGSAKKQLSVSLETVYLMTAMIIVTDCTWSILSYFNCKDANLLYVVNIIYFIAEIAGVFAWALFSIQTLDIKFFNQKSGLVLLSIPLAIDVLYIVTTSMTGFLFVIENGEYVRGSLFFIDVIIKFIYLILGCGCALYCAAHENRVYLKKRYRLLAWFCGPVLIGGAAQAICGLDLNCVAPVLALVIIYKHGIANEAKDNGDLVKAIAGSYSAAFIINADTHEVKTLGAVDDYRRIARLTGSLPYEEVLDASVQLNVLPEDRIRVEREFALDNVLKELKTKNAFSLVYRVNSNSGQDTFNKATFLKAFSQEDRHEMFLGIEGQEIRQILMSDVDGLSEEKENFERVKETFTTVIANVIEARDVDSGEHVKRVKDLTQLLCNQLMQDYPEYGLDPLSIRYITNGSALHDIGKIMIPDSILLKPGKLTREEFDIMKTHTVNGVTILDNIPEDLDPEYLRYAKEICRWHHEKYDGRGYPDGLKGDEIPISAQIVSLADCYDALTSKRVYRDAIPRLKALNMINNEECGVFNMDLLDCLSKVAWRLPK